MVFPTSSPVVTVSSMGGGRGRGKAVVQFWAYAYVLINNILIMGVEEVLFTCKGGSVW